MEPYAILLQAIFAVYVPTTMRSIANARGTFVPHVPVIVKPLNAGNEEGEVAIVVQKLLLNPPDNELAVILVKVPCSVKVFPDIWPLLICPAMLGTPNELESIKLPIEVAVVVVVSIGFNWLTEGEEET